MVPAFIFYVVNPCLYQGMPAVRQKISFYSYTIAVIYRKHILCL